MVARYVGASLELPAFAIVVTIGLIARNPVTVIRPHDIFTLFLILSFWTGYQAGSGATGEFRLVERSAWTRKEQMA